MSKRKSAASRAGKKARSQRPGPAPSSRPAVAPSAKPAGAAPAKRGDDHLLRSAVPDGTSQRAPEGAAAPAASETRPTDQLGAKPASPASEASAAFADVAPPTARSADAPPSSEPARDRDAAPASDRQQAPAAARTDEEPSEPAAAKPTPKESAPKSKPARDGARPGKAGDSERGDGPRSERPGVQRAGSQGDDGDLSLSGQFFRRDDDSLPPFIEEDPESELPVREVSPATLARRARFRRWVTGVVGFAGAVSIVVFAKTLAASRSGPRPDEQSAAAVVTPPATNALAVTPPTAREEAPAPPTPAGMAAPAAAAKDEAPAAAEPAAPSNAADAPAATAEAAAKEEAAAKAEPEAKEAKDEKTTASDSAPDPKAAAAHKEEALKLLSMGKLKDAIEAAKAVIAADPTDAIGYLCLGSALQDSGRWKDGIAAYSDCVRHASKGPVHECRALGGRK